MMKTVGLWIDLQKAVIVSATEQVVGIEFVNSYIDNRRWQLDVWELPAAIKQRMSDDQLGRFYANVSGFVLNARSVLIFGPGEAKSELRRRLGIDNYTGTIVGCETAGRMTESQIVSKVQHRFGVHHGVAVSAVRRALP
ncbi:MAG: hypothetical protein WBC19_07845 [Pyrinomonadaceae bacterium]|nr:hypothetical protein [Chloracidobacterium sp.]MBP7415563.1 hypothetical protein [Pyrinomonadaceae bacterium]